MSKTVMIVVSEDSATIDQAKKYWEQNDCVVHAFSPSQFREGLENSYFRQQLTGSAPTLAFGLNPLTPGNSPLSVVPGSGNGNVIQFPAGGAPAPSSSSANVQKMVDMEAQLIEQAIGQCRGNLTEAAKILGIGRATLYRKVKQYNIDPTQARRKKLVAA